jgi:diadenosine tetraphosphatase ApaH/serine/threonine PP2A family protein phosphatase
MPISAIVNNEYFCMHGGISPHLNSVNKYKYLIELDK